MARTHKTVPVYNFVYAVHILIGHCENPSFYILLQNDNHDEASRHA
jgi:hypothetical protein